MRGAREARELVGEQPPPLPPSPRCKAEPVRLVALEVPVANEAIEVEERDLALAAEEAVERLGIDSRAEALAFQPEHDLQDLVAPVDAAQGFALGLDRQ